MRKLLAVILSAVLMLSACAFTEGPGAGTCYSLSGVSVVTGETNIDLSGLEIGVDVMDDALVVHIDNGDERACEIGFTQVDDLYVIHLDSPTLGHKDYVIDPVMEMATGLAGLRDVLVEKLQNMDANAAAQSIYDFFARAEQAAAEAAEAPESTEAPVETPPAGLEVNTESIQEILKESINADQIITIDEDVTDPDTGEVLLPAGEYKMTGISVDKEGLLKVLGNMTMNGKPIPNVEMLKDENVDATLEAAFYVGQGDVDAGVGYLFVIASDGETDGYNGLYYIMTGGEDGRNLSVDVMGDMGEGHFDVQFTLSKHAVAGEAFGPDAVDLASAVNLSELNAAGEESPLPADLQMLLGDAVGAVLAPILAGMAVEAPAA